MILDDSFNLQGVTYQLQAAVLHYGDTPNSGHYVAAARHGSGAAPFFVYDDAVRKALPESLRSKMVLHLHDADINFYTCSLLYEEV